MLNRLLAPFILLGTLQGSESLGTVDELINAALKNHPSIHSSRQIVLGADAQVAGAKWGYYPTPSVDLSQGAGGRRGTTLRIDQPIWTGGKLDAAVDIAQSQKNESEYALDESAYSLIDTLLRTFQGYLQAQGSLKALQEGRIELETLREMLERRIEAGVSSLADRELLASRISQIDADIRFAQTKRTLSLNQLKLLTGEPVAEDLVLDHPPFEAQTASADRLITDMLSSHPSIKKIVAQIQTAEAEKVRAKAVLWPNVSLRAEHQRGSVYTDSSASDSYLYLNLQMSPGAGLSALSTIQSAESKILRIQFDKLSKEQQLSDTLLANYNNYHSAHDKIEGMRATIDSAQKVFDSYTRLFIAGKRQWLDLVNASRELTGYKTSLSDSEATRTIAAYQLALMRGEIQWKKEGEQ
ncbi:MAG: TolC family protein [Sulfuricurvum sp.]|nr:TolC family protein [Sulfuricurvum sp.]